MPNTSKPNGNTELNSFHNVPYGSHKFQKHPNLRGNRLKLGWATAKKVHIHRRSPIPALMGDLMPIDISPEESAIDQHDCKGLVSGSPRAIKEKPTDPNIIEGGNRQKSVFWIEASFVKEMTFNDKSSILGAKDAGSLPKPQAKVLSPKSSKDFLDLDLQLKRVVSGKSTIKASNNQHSRLESSNISMGKPPTFMKSAKFVLVQEKSEKKQTESIPMQEHTGNDSQASSIEQPKLICTRSGTSMPNVPRNCSANLRIDTNPDFGEMLRSYLLTKQSRL
jgi:hypothetical protein